MYVAVSYRYQPAHWICSSFLAGLLPLSLSLNPSQLRLISTIGMGVLVGTSLIVIIPEGVETLYSASLTGNGHVRRAPSSYPFTGNPLHSNRRTTVEMDSPLMAAPVLLSRDSPPPTPTLPGTVGILENDESEKKAAKSPEKSKDQDHHGSPHAWIGVALISGFTLMYIIDKLPQYTVPSKSTAQPHHISLSDLGRGLQRPASSDYEGEANEFLPNGPIGQRQGRSFATTTGLVIHAAADGIALGASSSSANTGLSLIIFLAIMVHKAPAAFGLTSVLLKQGLSKRTARAHLLLFSLAAPTGATLTWLFAHTLGAGYVGNAESTTWWTGMLLLFSGGTFLYVAMHTMQEVESSHNVQENGHVHGLGEGRETTLQPQKLSLRDLMASVLGMILPLFLQMWHAH